ncbi:hypothetical protein [Candidatus Similichlamydia epinepheli]|uniref:hypothetical protein n=1 Tax=Candidatus Similichlamydia epinepheli TaxID=1903953 RepID=UPI000D36BD88|nr:hypothetical protein [Candidatus Similichlamydia epinepheli]
MPLSLEGAPYLAISYYRFWKILDVEAEVQSHLSFFRTIDVRSRAYVASYGVNVQLSISTQDYHILQD